MALKHSTSHSDIRNLLETQLAAATQLRDVLTREYDILRQASPEGLEALLPEKQSALEAVATADHALRETLGEESLEGSASDIARLMDELDPSGTLAGHWQRLAEVLRECETRNQTNGSLVEMSRQQVELALNVLRGETPATATYGANGQTVRTSRSRSIAEA